MNQIEYETEWLTILNTYVRPLQEKAFTGYFHNVSNKVFKIFKNTSVCYPCFDAVTFNNPFNYCLFCMN